MKKHAYVQFEILSTTSFHLYFVMTINFFLQMDREWMYIGIRVSQYFIEGLETFLETAVEYKKPENMSDVHYIYCPCVDCSNVKKTQNIEEIQEHLLIRGFMSGYTCWTEHGEYKEVVGGDDNVDETNHCWTEQNMAREDTDV
jgi:hypothetical protein